MTLHGFLLTLGGFNRCGNIMADKLKTQCVKYLAYRQIIFNPGIHKHDPSVLMKLDRYKCGQLETITNQSTVKPTLLKQTGKSMSVINSKKPQMEQSLKSSKSVSQKSPSGINNKPQFLTIPNAIEVLQLQKVKQQKMAEEYKNQLNEKKQSPKTPKIEEVKQAQSEILGTKFSSAKKNDIYEKWKEQQQEQSKSVILTKRSNQFYEEWKQRQSQILASPIQQVVDQVPNQEEIEGGQEVFGQELQSILSKQSEKSIVQEDPQLEVPVLTPVALLHLKKKKKSDQLI